MIVKKLNRSHAINVIHIRLNARLVALVVAYISDRTQWLAVYVVVFGVIGIAGYIFNLYRRFCFSIL
ncbi:uncharacterized protein BDW43DRAFT_273991 [Aspergillus alliaceus]|uniref:uncharacterized protein n=1 Tax=Petromyces alliaceus TaxID=209559 RepID=UPI0012A72BB4|nr:uncharacterized protein BDW43DRAFT_273991 [Aspergillus alliaceus]KAB8234370.1 hypothetical protein BDW43DRAFT_273991 [Aspergillus alliaceus]